MVEACERLRGTSGHTIVEGNDFAGAGELQTLSRSDTREILESEQFGLMVGDVGDPLFWGDEVKKAMVSLHELP